MRSPELYTFRMNSRRVLLVGLSGLACWFVVWGNSGDRHLIRLFPAGNIEAFIWIGGALSGVVLSPLACKLLVAKRRHTEMPVITYVFSAIAGPLFSVPVIVLGVLLTDMLHATYPAIPGITDLVVNGLSALLGACLTGAVAGKLLTEPERP